jgi:hypothetical protein
MSEVFLTIAAHLESDSEPYLKPSMNVEAIVKEQTPLFFISAFYNKHSPTGAIPLMFAVKHLSSLGTVYL